MKSKKYVIQKFDINVKERETERNRLLKAQSEAKAHIENLRKKLQTTLESKLASKTKAIEAIKQRNDIEKVKKSLEIQKLELEYSEYEYNQKNELALYEHQILKTKSGKQTDNSIDDDTYQIPQLAKSYEIFIRDEIFSINKCIILYIIEDKELVNLNSIGWNYRIGEGYLSVQVESNVPYLKVSSGYYGVEDVRLSYEHVSSPEGIELQIFYE